MQKVESVLTHGVLIKKNKLTNKSNQDYYFDNKIFCVIFAARKVRTILLS
jgi:hypothetical protein